MKLIGTASETKNDKGLYTLTIRGLTIPLRGLPDKYAGRHICVAGMPRWASDVGSYFRVSSCYPSGQPDQNDVVISGTVVSIFPERKNERNRRSACIMVRQSEAPSSTVLITALSSNVDILQPDNLSIGMQIEIGGYISFHGRGLHVLYMETINKEVVQYAREV